MNNTQQLFSDLFQLLRPPPKLTASEWANMHVVLSTEDSAEPGKYSTDRAPYQKEMLDAVSNPDVSDVVYMTGSQIGKTQLIKNILGYFIDFYPSPIMFMVPTLDLAKEFSKTRIAPFIRDTKVLSEKMADTKARDSGNTLLNKTFPGGYLTFVGANSPAGLASRPIRVLLADEIDRFPASAGAEGDPVSLAEKRTKTFYNRKHIYASTPLGKGTSRIEKLYNDGTQEVWHLKCPACGEYVYPSWDKFEADTEANQYYMCCEHCGTLSDEWSWKRLYSEGRWIANAPENLETKHCRSFHINAFASPWTSWAELYQTYEAAQALGAVGLKTFFNTEMGIPYEDAAETPPTDELMDRREEYGADLPEGVLILTAGVDTQDDRLECEVMGWGLNGEQYGVQYYRLYGDPAQDAVWNALDDIIIRGRWSFVDGRKRGVSATCIDSGGNKTQAVYRYCSKRRYHRVYAIKGVGGANKDIIDGLPTKLKKHDNAKLFKIGVDTGKDLIMSDLRQLPGEPRYCHFPLDPSKGYNKKYFEGLLAEIKTEELVRGRYVQKWTLRPGVKRNEPLDVRNYNHAAINILNPNFEALAERAGREDFTPYIGNNSSTKTARAPAKYRRRKVGGGVKL